MKIKTCHICKIETEESDICLEATIDITDEKLYFCFPCLFGISQDKYKLNIQITSKDGNYIDTPGIVTQWGIYSAFINPQNNGVK